MDGFKLESQGAEARLYKGTYLGKTTLIKERFHKKYRHPDLDSHLTKDRIRAEARAIVRAKAAGAIILVQTTRNISQAGVPTPALFLVDLDRRSIYMEYVENAQTLKKFIEERGNPGVCVGDNDGTMKIATNWLDRICQKLASLIAKLHSKNIIHGDLTTSNVLLRHGEFSEQEEPHLVLVDFGLARVESTIEDKAVDLYVLERSMMSSHSEWPTLFPTVLGHYAHEIRNEKQRHKIISKYKEVSTRGRKRPMIG